MEKDGRQNQISQIRQLVEKRKVQHELLVRQLEQFDL
jgi:hypothetical protein